MTRRTPQALLVPCLLVCACALADPDPAERRAPVENPDWARQVVSRKLAQTGHLLEPAGETLTLTGRVLGVAAVRGGRFLVVKTDTGTAVVDAARFKLLKQYAPAEKHAADVAAKASVGWAVYGGSMHGLAVGEDDATIYVTGKARHLFVGQVSERGELVWGPSVDCAVDKRTSNPLGIGLAPGGKLAVVALALANQAALVDLAAGQVVATVPVGVCPYGVAVSRDGSTAFVSNYGGSPPAKGDRTEKVKGLTKDGTLLAVDERSVALRGTVSVIDLAQRKVVGEIATRIHPESVTLSPDGRRLYVLDAGGDGVSVIDVAARRVVETLDTKPRRDLPYGSLACGLAVSADGRTLYTANAGNNAVALLDLTRPADPPFGFIAAGGFPGSVCVTGDTLYCGNVVGFAGDLQKVPLPRTPDELKALTATATRGFHLAEIVRATAQAATGVAPQPVPAQVGEPSTIKHVVYIIKENKKFDQVLGDLGRGNAEPKFCEFGRAITPNAHALADQFVLLDNYYCNGVLSCDGHQWATQGVTTPYREKDWGNLHCTYSFGTDPLCFAGCGFIWDQVLRGGLSFRNFGELGYGVAPSTRWTANYQLWRDGQAAGKLAGECKFDGLSRYTDLRAPGWDMSIPDQVRADVFLKALGEFTEARKMPDLVILYLPNDHTQGGSAGNPTPRAYVVDNDLALGRVVQGLTQSPFWQDMAIFVNEDDPQTGADHVDGHRSFCFVASPYAKHGGAVVSQFYNQASVLHTICRILGVPPLNQTVALAPVMSACFQPTPDLRGFTCRPATVPLDELNGKKLASRTAARLAPLTAKLDFSAPDRLDKDALLFSRWVWATVRGEEPFPAAYTGPHGKGLAALGLKLAPVDDDDD